MGKRFNQIKSADDLHRILVEMDRNFDTYSTDLKYFATHAVLLLPLRSIAFRLRPVLEENKAVHSSAVSALKSLAAALRIYLPQEHWKAGFEYVTAPSTDGTLTNSQFHKISDFQKSLVKELAPQIFNAIRRLVALGMRSPNRIVWDNRLLAGTGTFEDGIQRFATHGMAEICASLSALHMSLHALYAYSAYFQDDAPDVAFALGRLAGIDGFLASLPLGNPEDLGITAHDRASVLRRGEFVNFLKLHSKVGNGRSKLAFEHLKASISRMEEAWRYLESGENRPHAVLNPLAFAADKRIAELRLKNMQAMLNGPTAMRSARTGEVVTVDLKSFYTSPYQDLKVLLPTRFDETPAERSLASSDGRTLRYRNYYRGRAVAWDKEAWKKVFPIDSHQVATSVRVLSENWGADYASPLFGLAFLL
jgi:hypothetical protein